MPRGQLRASLLDLFASADTRRADRRWQKRAQSLHSRHDLDRPKAYRSERATDSRPLGRRLIIGKGNLSQVGTLVERKSLFVALVKLPNGKGRHGAECFYQDFQTLLKARCAFP